MKHQSQFSDRSTTIQVGKGAQRVWIQLVNPGSDASNSMDVIFFSKPSPRTVECVREHVGSGYTEERSHGGKFTLHYIYNAMVDELKAKIVKQCLHLSGHAYLPEAFPGANKERLDDLFNSYKARTADGMRRPDGMVGAETLSNVESIIRRIIYKATQGSGTNTERDDFVFDDGFYQVEVKCTWDKKHPTGRLYEAVVFKDNRKVGQVSGTVAILRDVVNMISRSTNKSALKRYMAQKGYRDGYSQVLKATKGLNTFEQLANSLQKLQNVYLRDLANRDKSLPQIGAYMFKALQVIARALQKNMASSLVSTNFRRLNEQSTKMLNALTRAKEGALKLSQSESSPEEIYWMSVVTGYLEQAKTDAENLSGFMSRLPNNMWATTDVEKNYSGPIR